MSLVVIDPGLASRIVDRGRPRTRSLGVPVGGAADLSSFVLGNALVGNGHDAAALEITLKGPILRAEDKVHCVLFGAPFELSTARQRPRHGTTFLLEGGEELHIAGTPRGMRAYLCVAGGFKGPEVLGSRSGLSDLARGDRLLCDVRQGRPGRRLPEAPLAPWRVDEPVLRCLSGLQADWFDTQAFERQEFTVSLALNRMGIRLEGEALAVPERELVSEPVAPGAVQVTRDGQCIVLGVDGQTIGGYPKLAQVIRADIDRLGQLRPGVKLRFQFVNQEEARRAYLQKEARLAEWGLRARASS